MECHECKFYRFPEFEKWGSFNKEKNHLVSLVDSLGRYIHAHCSLDMKPVSYYDDACVLMVKDEAGGE